ncbi:hypothetical protein A9Q02_22980 [Candidatus Chloroploca asiatica]|uniref:Uncharacterized protein n=1 Tax=Candidatus Chloroploca asiatica TaxID=1506545 RepID=A0A2H3KP91_9CHLR|nr:hypothetical protein A9Q02_22980 [Candidatus Chloroploca asiatica]
MRHEVGRQVGEGLVGTGRVLAIVPEHINRLDLALRVDEAFGARRATLAPHLAAAAVRTADGRVVDSLPVTAEHLLEVRGPGQRTLALAARAQAELLAQRQQLAEVPLLFDQRSRAGLQMGLELVDLRKQLRVINDN